jgi:hypothetical protein
VLISIARIDRLNMGSKSRIGDNVDQHYPSGQVGMFVMNQTVHHTSSSEYMWDLGFAQAPALSFGKFPLGLALGCGSCRRRHCPTRAPADVTHISKKPQKRECSTHRKCKQSLEVVTATDKTQLQHGGTC